MKIVLATGIYPPDIGGPATYVRALAAELARLGNAVSVVTYGRVESGKRKVPAQTMAGSDGESDGAWNVVSIDRSGGPLLRWWRYARALRKVAADADIVEAFSSVSVGVPLLFARVKKPKKILRLGGDFFWERYTDRGGGQGLQEWYDGLRRWHLKNCQWKAAKLFMETLLQSFDHLIFSTELQKSLYQTQYRLSAHSVIENALPAGMPVLHAAHAPFRLLFLGRFVAFKNLTALLRSLAFLPRCSLALVGDGPMLCTLRTLSRELHLEDRVTFLPPHGVAAKGDLFADADLLVLPSITEISPNTALEARAVGLPVLLTRATGFGETLTRGMVLRNLVSPEQIAKAIADVRSRYGEIAAAASLPAPVRGWDRVAREHLQLFQSL